MARHWSEETDKELRKLVANATCDKGHTGSMSLLEIRDPETGEEYIGLSCKACED